MKKILIPIDYTIKSDAAIDYAVMLSEKEDNLIVGVYVKDFFYEHVILNDPEQYIPSYYYPFEGVQSLEYNVIRDEQVEDHIKFFYDKCQEYGVKYAFHENKGILSSEMIKESAFADLLVTGYHHRIVSADESIPADIARLLRDSLCPVLLVPEKYSKPDKIIIAYDNSVSALFALKQFYYLFPSFCNGTIAHFVMVDNDVSGKASIQESLIKELTKIHFKNVQFSHLSGDVSWCINRVCEEVETPFLVMGAFGRNPISEFFNPSVGEKVLKGKKIPVFIAHSF
jgi:nucleotide-binding universal stress UspA family protein